jgi:hypothetical protein
METLAAIADPGGGTSGALALVEVSDGALDAASRPAQ